MKKQTQVSFLVTCMFLLAVSITATCQNGTPTPADGHTITTARFCRPSP